MDSSDWFKPKWFRELEENRKEFYNVENIIESAKFKYDREFNFPKWLVGTGVAILFSSAVWGAINTLNPLFKIATMGGMIISALEFLIALFTLIALDKRQKMAMMYLYREKDKQEEKNSSKRI